MNKDVAAQLWDYAHQQREREFRAWGALSSRSGRENEKQAEAHRVKCADWATACNELYAQMNPPLVKAGATTK